MLHRIRVQCCFSLLWLALPVVAAAAEPASPRVAVQRFVDDQVIAGAVTLVAHEGRTVSLEAVGQADLDSQKPMRPNQLFWIASMTKPMTAVCVLLLQDEGKLSVDDPVEKHLPEFKDLWLVEERAKDRLVLKRPARVITIKDLLTHTSGLGNMETPRPTATLAELVGGYAKLPLQFEPGSRWQYSNPGINTLGRLVEVVSGMPFAEFMDQRLFRPLGMNQTTFWPTPAQQKRIATSYQPASSGKGLEPTEVTFLRGAPLEDQVLPDDARWRCRAWEAVVVRVRRAAAHDHADGRHQDRFHRGHELGAGLPGGQGTAGRDGHVVAGNLRSWRRLRHAKLGRSADEDDLRADDPTRPAGQQRWVGPAQGVSGGRGGRDSLNSDPISKGWPKETKRDERAGEDLEWHRLRMRDSPVSHSRALFGPSSASGFSAVKKTGR
jgi:CubicO group peptidase (beta-lactamase class C family)